MTDNTVTKRKNMEYHKVRDIYSKYRPNGILLHINGKFKLSGSNCHIDNKLAISPFNLLVISHYISQDFHHYLINISHICVVDLN
jgi:hypothetical protein